MKMSMQDPYAVLGVRRNAGPDEIKAAWRAMAKAIHPDRNREDPTASARFAEAGRAYEVLKDPKMRNRYDQARRDADLRRMEEMKRRADRARAPEPPADAETVEEAMSRIFATDAPKGPAPKGAAGAKASAAPAAPPPGAKPAAAPAAPEASADGRPGAAPRAPSPQASAAAGTPPTGTGEAGARGEPEAAGAPAGPSILARAAAPAADLVTSLFRRIRPVPGAVETEGKAGERAAEKSPSDRPADRPADRAAERIPDLVCEALATVEDLFRKRRVTATLPDGQVLKVALPDGTTDGSTLRLREQGYRQGGQRGDAVVSIRVARHERFRVDGTHLRTTLVLSLHDAVLGCTASVATVTGRAQLNVPAWSGPDRPLTLPGEGLTDATGRRGDLIVELSLTLGERPDQKLTDLMRSQRDGLVL